MNTPTPASAAELLAALLKKYEVRVSNWKTLVAASDCAQGHMKQAEDIVADLKQATATLREPAGEVVAWQAVDPDNGDKWLTYRPRERDGWAGLGRTITPLYAAPTGAVAQLERCPDGCYRPKARNASDCAAGCCAKHYAVRDPEAAAECEKIAAYWREQQTATPPEQAGAGRRNEAATCNGQAGAVGEFVLVPREPTDAMLSAMLGPMPPFVRYWHENGRLNCEQESGIKARARAVEAWRGTLAAAPQPHASATGGAEVRSAEWLEDAAEDAQPEHLTGDGSLTYAGQRKVVAIMSGEIHAAVKLLQSIQQRAEALDCQPMPKGDADLLLLAERWERDTKARDFVECARQLREALRTHAERGGRGS